MKFSESDAEEVTLDLFKELGYSVAYGPDIEPEMEHSERSSFSDVVLVGRLKEAIERINPWTSKDVVDDVVRKVRSSPSQQLIENNRAFHRLLVDGVDVEVRTRDGTKWQKVYLIDFEHPEKNDWLAVNQFTIIENHVNRRPDVIVSVNGLPLALFELKNPADENATIWSAYNQLQTYEQQIPTVFNYNEICIISDGLEARHGTLTASKEWFLPWKTADGEHLAPRTMPQIEVLVKGIFDKKRFLDIVKNFVFFQYDKKTTVKIMAAYHQYHAVNEAIDATVQAIKPAGDRRCGVVWHTQGSGKSFSMVMYAAKLISRLNNPTIVVLTDRNDLDEQLFKVFAKSEDILRQTPVQAESMEHLQQQLKRASGGIIFTTIQKFMPEKDKEYPPLSDRRNIIVIADEAHRSQYDFIDGFARHMREALPNASFIGFTGTPIEKADRNTRAVFGDYIDQYDIFQAVEDGATVKIYYESRLAQLNLKTEKIDEEFEEVTEGEEAEGKERLKSKWARLEAVVGAKNRVKIIAKDIVSHFEQRQQAMAGKAMIVCMSRRISVDLYDEIVKLRPDWASKEDDKGIIKVVMTGSASDPVGWQQHIRTKKKREEMANRFKDPADPFKIVIVRDMWLTGFDAPCLHTMYIDKPMQGHGLMQAIARVNRVFKDKPGGLVVDYIGIADQLKKALAEYSHRDRETTALPQEQAVSIMQEKYEITKGFFHGFNYQQFFSASKKDCLVIILQAMDQVLKQQDGKQRYIQAVADLSKAFALAVPSPQAIKIRDEVAFFQAIKAGITKEVKSEKVNKTEAIESAIQQIISKAVSSDQVIDVYTALGMKNNVEISILSDKFLEELKGAPYKNLALEALKRLLENEIRIRSKTNLVQSRAFSEMLEKTLKRYQNRSIQTAEVIAELVNLAKEMREAHKKGEHLGLSDEELAFYDSLETNDSAVKILGDNTLRAIARELTQSLRDNVTVDWSVKESVRAKLRLLVKKILKKHHYPPDKQEKAIQTVLEQAELIGEKWIPV